MSLPQTMLWRELRKRPGGFKFRREHPAGQHYFLDFFVAALRLDIEVPTGRILCPENVRVLVQTHGLSPLLNRRLIASV